MGGVLYSRLKQKFCSPFINMWLEDNDLIKFALNIEKYVKEKLRFILIIAKQKMRQIYIGINESEELIKITCL